MSTTKIKAKLIKASKTITIVYRNGKLLRIENGNLTRKELDSIGMIVPLNKSNLSDFVSHWAGKIEYTLEETQPTLHQEMVDLWIKFYEDFIGVPPKFTGADGKAMKDIRVHLTTIGGSPKDALFLWGGILKAWKDLEKFHHKNTDLKYINSRLNAILSEIKQNNSQNRQATNDERYSL